MLYNQTETMLCSPIEQCLKNKQTEQPFIDKQHNTLQQNRTLLYSQTEHCFRIEQDNALELNGTMLYSQ